MAHGAYVRRRIAERRPVGRRSKGLGVDKKKKKPKPVTLKNQIRSTERILRKNLPLQVREVQEKKLEGLKKQQEIHTRATMERKIHLRGRKIKFFERRKIERMIRRLEKQQRTSSDHISEGQISDQLSKLREDLEYVRFFPKTEKYVSLFVGGDKADIIDRRNKLRKQIKANLVAAAASGKDLEETASDDDVLDTSEDDFFLTGSSSDEVEADDEWTDKSTREPASSASGKAASSMSSDEKNQRQVPARVLMPPPRPLTKSSNSTHAQTRFACSSSRNVPIEKVELSTSSNTSHSRSGPSSKSWGSLNARTDNNSNLSSNSDAHKPRRKRRPKKKKQAKDQRVESLEMRVVDLEAEGARSSDLHEREKLRAIKIARREHVVIDEKVLNYWRGLFAIDTLRVAKEKHESIRAAGQLPDFVVDRTSRSVAPPGSSDRPAPV